MKIKLLKSLFTVGAFLCFALVQAQEVTGTVSDATGPLPGASVVVKGTTTGTQTDFDGNYTIEVDDGGTLVFSYIGYAAQEIAVSGQSTINVVLVEDAQALEEVVVIGYGTTTVKDATGAVASVSSDDFNGGVIASPEQLIQGKTAGVQITSSSGEPGAGVNVRIRGTTSVRSGNDPLFVVDGVPLTNDSGAGGSLDTGQGSQSGRNPLNFLNPNDIASISILKDASSTAIYGSRAANGVVIITTKQGKSNQGLIEYGSTYSVSTPQNEFDLLNRRQYLDAIAQYGGNPTDLDFGHDTDWQDEITRSPLSMDQNLAYSRSYGSGNYRISFNYGNQQGIIENSSLERITGRLNFNHRMLDDKLKLSGNFSYSRTNDEFPPISETSGFRGDLLGATYIANPSWPATASFQLPGATSNPLASLEYTLNLARTNRYLVSASGEYNITDNLSAKLFGSYDFSDATREQVTSGLLNGGDRNTFGNGRGGFVDRDISTSQLDFTVNYKKEFENSRLDFLAGYSYQEFTSEGITVQAFGYDSTDLTQMLQAQRDADGWLQSLIDQPFERYGYDNDSFFINFYDFANNSGELLDLPRVRIRGVQAIGADRFNTKDELQSFFGRVNYSLKDRYLFTATLRADGSSKFGPNKKYGYFPSAAFAWNISEEEFLPEAFSNLKLRLGYGVVGNQTIPNNVYQGRAEFQGLGPDDGGNVNPGGTTPVAFNNPDLQWEETEDLNIGLDFGFANNRISGSIDLYQKNTTKLLFQVFAAQPAPNPFQWQNLDAEVTNQGIDFSLNLGIIDTEDASWDLGFNLNYNENEVTGLNTVYDTGQIRGQGLTGAFAQRIANGQPLFSYYLREFAGFDASGQSIYPNGNIQEFVGKSALPDYNIGFSNNVTYKNWDFGVFFAGQFGHYIYNNTANGFFTAGNIANGRNVTTDVVTNGESNINPPDVSTRFLESGDFLRLQNASIGYNFDLVDTDFLKTLRLYLNGQNLLVITDYSGLDPEVTSFGAGISGIPSLGVDYTSYPRPRTITFGINATF